MNIEEMAGQVVEAARGFVQRSLVAVNARLADLERQIEALPPPPKGDKGDQGDQGDPGKDADPETVRAEVARAVAEIPRPRDGKDAEPVDINAVAERAASLVRPAMIDEVWSRVEAVLDESPDPADGKDGRDGRDGADGKDGAPGRDAAELDILPSIDEAKSYRRGTWASHKGGLIRAARETDPVKDGALVEAGWVVMVEGKACPTAITQGDDPREITCTEMLTSGAKAVTTFRIPMVIDRGVWREGAHEKGDHVSWDGSGWIAQRATADKPGTSDAWRLSTKRGRDGKDGSPGAAPAAQVVRVK